MNPIVMIYPTYNAAMPRLIVLPYNYTDDQFLQFVTELAAAIRESGSAGYERQSVTMQVLISDGSVWQSVLNVEI